MSRNVEELKKVVAMVTTAAGDVSLVEGNTKEEVLEYMVKNLNTDESRALLISQLRTNCLSEPIVFTAASQINLDKRVDIVEGASYVYEGYYGAANTPFTTSGWVSSGLIDAANRAIGSEEYLGTVAVEIYTENPVGGGKTFMTLSARNTVENDPTFPITITGLYKIG